MSGDEVRDSRGRVYEYGRWYPPKATRLILDPLATAWSSIRIAIEWMTDAELALLVEALDQSDFTTTNCGWAEYEVLNAFERRIREEGARRKARAKEAA